MRVAIIHDWLVTEGGAERVLEQILHLYPSADVFSVVDRVPAEMRGFLGGRRARTTVLQHLPGVRRYYRLLLPLMPWAISRWDLSGYDLVISCSHAVAKGVRTTRDQLHVCLCYTPMRYLWGQEEDYSAQSRIASMLPKSVIRWGLSRLRRWDVETSASVDQFIAISHHIAERIRTAYGRESLVVYPPVDTDAFTPGGARGDSFVTVSRLVPYKHVSTIVEAFKQLPDERLIVIGDGPDLAKLRSAAGSNVQILGRQPREVVLTELRRAKGFIFAAQEDFGIAPLEAQACGTPVIAYAAGGALETILGQGSDAPSGVFFREQTPNGVAVGVREFLATGDAITPAQCRKNAQRFGVTRFRDELAKTIEDAREQCRQRGARENACAQPRPLRVGSDDRRSPEGG